MQVCTQELPTVREEHVDETIALRFGTFDIVHDGHHEGLAFTADQADLVVVGVTDDEMVRRSKGPERPINPAQARLEIIDELAVVDYTFLLPNHALGIARAVRLLHPDVYVEHREYGRGRWRALFLGALGIDYCIDHGDKIDSTTDIIRRLGIIPAKTD